MAARSADRRSRPGRQGRQVRDRLVAAGPDDGPAAHRPAHRAAPTPRRTPRLYPTRPPAPPASRPRDRPARASLTRGRRGYASSRPASPPSPCHLTGRRKSSTTGRSLAPGTSTPTAIIPGAAHSHPHGHQGDASHALPPASHPHQAAGNPLAAGIAARRRERTQAGDRVAAATDDGVYAALYGPETWGPRVKATGSSGKWVYVAGAARSQGRRDGALPLPVGDPACAYRRPHRVPPGGVVHLRAGGVHRHQLFWSCWCQVRRGGRPVMVVTGRRGIPPLPAARWGDSA